MAEQIENPYEISDMDPDIVKELTLRESTIGLAGGSYYSAPRSVGMRFASNSRGPAKKSENGEWEQDPKFPDGFILSGLSKRGNLFEETYGFNGRGTFLGTDIFGESIYDNGDDPLKHRPTPGVTSIRCNTMGQNGKFLECTVNWSCWSAYQLNILFPYFLTSGISAECEWGWNNFPGGQTDFSDIDYMKSLWEKAETHREYYKKHQYNSMIIVGIITGFTFGLNGDGGYDCTTTISSLSDLIKATSNNPKGEESTVDENNQKTKSKIISPSVWIEKNFKKIVNSDKDTSVRSHFSDLNDFGDDVVSGRYNLNTFKSKIVSLKEYKKNTKDTSHDYEYWHTNESAIYIRFDLLLELYNILCAQKQKGDSKSGPADAPESVFFDMDIMRSVYITAHPNLKSNSPYLIIPNKIAPLGKYSNKLNKEGNKFEGFFGKKFAHSDKFKNATDALIKCGIDTEFRVDILSILKQGRLPSIETEELNPFPLNYQEESGDDGAWFGRLIDLWVSETALKDMFANSDKTIAGLETVLKTMSAASGGIWDFKIGPSTQNAPNHGQIIVDKSFTKLSIAYAIAPSAMEESMQRNYTFKYNTKKSIVTAASFNGQQSDAVVMTTLNDSADGSHTSKHTSKSMSAMPRLDRLVPIISLGKSTLNSSVPDPAAPGEIENKAKEKKYMNFLKKGKDDKGESCHYIVRCLEIDTDLQKSLTMDHNPFNNTMYNFPLPGTSLNFTILGISGLYFMNRFHFMGLPDAYTYHCVFTINEISHNISSDGWFTEITGLFVTGSPDEK